MTWKFPRCEYRIVGVGLWDGAVELQCRMFWPLPWEYIAVDGTVEESRARARAHAKERTRFVLETLGRLP